MEDIGCRLVESLDAEGIGAGLAEVIEVKEQDSQQHQYRAEQGVEEKLDRGIQFARAAPDSDQQVHWNQHGFPKNKKQKEWCSWTFGKD